MARNGRTTAASLAALPMREVLEQLAARDIEQPGTDLLLDVVNTALEIDPALVQQALRAVALARMPVPAPAPAALGPQPAGTASPTWRNYVGQGTGAFVDGAPKLTTVPDDVPAQVAWVQGLVAAAGPVRFAGFGHSSSDVTWGPAAGRVVGGRVPYGPYAPDKPLNATIADLGQDYTDPGGSLRWVSALQTVWAINEGLAAANVKLALPTMGSFDGQSLAGVLTTGTHGSGGKIGAIVDQVAAFVVVTRLPDAQGQPRPVVLQIEPTTGVTDPQKFKVNPVKAKWGLVQDDATFDAVSAAVGNMGAIVAVLMRTVPMGWIHETRGMTTWGEVRAIPDFFNKAKITKPGHRQELIFVPYAGPMGPTRPYGIADAHCQVVFREDIPAPQGVAPPNRPTEWVKELIPAGGNHPDQTARVQAALFRLFPTLVGPLLRSALKGLFKKLPQTEPSWNGITMRGWSSSIPKVLILGTGWQITASGIEINAPLPYAKKLVETFLSHAADRARNEHQPFTTPCGMRFVQSGREALLPHRRGYDEPTVTLEIGMILPGDEQQLRDEMWANLRGLERKILDKVPFARMHWGLATPDLRPTDFETWYPARVTDAWKAARATLDPYRAFTNGWAQRMGLCGSPNDQADVAADVQAALQRLQAVAKVMPG